MYSNLRRYFTYILYISLFSCIGTLSTAQYAEKSNFELSLFFPTGVLMGTNVYNNYHEEIWNGWGISTGIYLSKRYFINLEYSRLKGDVTNKNIVFSEATQLTYRALSLGYRFQYPSFLDITSYLHLSNNKGKNQGDFKGYSYGLGLKIVKPLWGLGMVFLNTEWNNHSFNIVSNTKWENQFNHAHIIRIALGGGLYIN